MSVSIFFISLIFGIIEGGLSWLLLACRPVAGLFEGLPLWAVTGIVFGLGMLLTFILIILVGSMNISDRAASFVNDHFGRTVALAALCVIAVMVVSIGGEMLYQANPIPRHQKKTIKSDVCFVLDYSVSMDVGGRSDAMKTAFEEAIKVMSPEQRVNVIKYTHEAALLFDWAQLTDDVRSEVVNVVRAEGTDGATDFNKAIALAGEQVDKAVAAGRSVAVVMISDGEDDTFRGVQAVAPTILDHNVQIHTICVSDGGEGNLHEISDETGGAYLTSGSDVANFSAVMVQATEQAGNSGGTDDTSIPDTLLTERWVTRKTIINARVLRILILFLLGFWFKFIAIICIGNNDSSALTHVLHALFVAIVAALFVEFGYGFGLPVALVLVGFWVLMITQIVRTDR